MAEKVPAQRQPMTPGGTSPSDQGAPGGEQRQQDGAHAGEANGNVISQAATALGVVASIQKVPSKRHDQKDHHGKNMMEMGPQELEPRYYSDPTLAEAVSLPPLPAHAFGRLYEPILRQHQQRYQDNYTIVPYPPKTIGNVHDQERSLPECRCSTNCLSLYCPCFAAVAHCSIDRCGCNGCRNDGHRDHAQERRYATHYATVHHPQSFRVRMRRFSLPPSTSGAGAGSTTSASRNSSDVRFRANE